MSRWFSEVRNLVDVFLALENMEFMFKRGFLKVTTFKIVESVILQEMIAHLKLTTPVIAISFYYLKPGFWRTVSSYTFTLWMFSFFMTVNGGLLLLEVLYARYSVYSLLMESKIHFYISIFERWIKNTLIVKTYN